MTITVFHFLAEKIFLTYDKKYVDVGATNKKDII